MTTVQWVGLAVLVLLLPGYLYVLSKFAQVGRMAGARWFDQVFNRGRKRDD